MVISVDDFESLQMTRELLAEPGAVRDILAADREIAAGDFHTLDELPAALERRQCQESLSPCTMNRKVAAVPGVASTESFSASTMRNV